MPRPGQYTDLAGADKSPLSAPTYACAKLGAPGAGLLGLAAVAAGQHVLQGGRRGRAAVVDAVDDGFAVAVPLGGESKSHLISSAFFSGSSISRRRRRVTTLWKWDSTRRSLSPVTSSRRLTVARPPFLAISSKRWR